MRHILLIISGSIAAYKGLELMRRGRERGYRFTPILTAGAQQFITPLAAASLAEAHCYTDLFSLKDETEMGHIRLSREADAILIAPASADLLAKMAGGRCDDLASTVLLATDKPVFAAPGMNHKMWEHPAMQRNLEQLITAGVTIIQPEAGALACGEVGTGRMAEVATILDFMDGYFNNVPSPVYGGELGRGKNDASSSPLSSSPRKRGEGDAPLAGRRALVTAGPTYEPLDPVRYLSNHSSGKQGYAIAAALAAAGARVTLVSGPTALPAPEGVTRITIRTAQEMLLACEQALPADIAVCTAAVSDWRPQSTASQKIKKHEAAHLTAAPPHPTPLPKGEGSARDARANGRQENPLPLGEGGERCEPGEGSHQPKEWAITLIQTPDILAALAAHATRPRLLIGFAAETHQLLPYARDKLTRKGCDWIVANDISRGVFGEDDNQVTLITAEGEDTLPRMSKRAVADALVERIIRSFSDSVHGQETSAEQAKERSE